MQRQKPSMQGKSGRNPSKFSASCKFLCCAVLIIGALFNLLLTTILLFGVENYHKADPVMIYEVFESPKYAETNHLLETTQYLVLYGEPQSGIINFIEHEANLRTIEGKPVVMREIEENIVHKHLKETKHFVEMYLGQLARGQHSWFILLQNTDVPLHEIEALKKKYPKDSIVLIAHQKIDIEGFGNHNFPSLKAKELKQFMEKDLDISSQEVKQILQSAPGKDVPAIFQAYKSFEEEKAQAIEEAEKLKKQQEEEERLRLEEQARLNDEKATEEQEGKKSKKDKKAAKGKKGKSAPKVSEEEVKSASVEQEETPKKKKSAKKSKAVDSQSQEEKEKAKDQKPAKESKKKSKKGKKSAIESKVEQKLEETLEKLPLEPTDQEVVKVEEEQKDEGKKGKSKNNKKDKKAKTDKIDQTEEKQVEEPKEEPKEEEAKAEEPAQVEDVKQEVTPTVEEVIEPVEEIKEEPETKKTKKSKSKGKGKKGDEETKKGKKASKKSKQTPKDAEPINEEIPHTEETSTNGEIPPVEQSQPAAVDTEKDSTEETQ